MLSPFVAERLFFRDDSSFCSVTSKLSPTLAINPPTQILISATEIGTLLELEVDLIVIGRHSKRGIATLILGSVAEQVAKIADASVLLVRKH